MLFYVLVIWLELAISMHKKLALLGYYVAGSGNSYDYSPRNKPEE
jgi:hypothetical protein